MVGLPVFFMRDGEMQRRVSVIRIILAMSMSRRSGEVNLMQGCFLEVLTEWCDE